MNFHVISIFPEMIREYLKMGIMSKAESEGLFQVNAYDLRDYSLNKYRKIDKAVTGHGKGMLFEPGPLIKLIRGIQSECRSFRVVYMTPGGRKLDQAKARELAKEENLIIISARYEGIDARVVRLLVDDEISIGDYVLTGGELPALVLMDAVSRFIPGTVKAGSLEEESFEDGLLEYEHYTEPVEFEGLRIPDVLRSGNHAEIEKLRYESRLRQTYFNRIDLLREYRFPFGEAETKNELKRIKKKNRELREYLIILQKIAKEWKNGGRAGKERRY